MSASPVVDAGSLGRDLFERARREAEFERRYDPDTWSIVGEGTFACVGRILDRDLGEMVALKLFWRLTAAMRTRIQAEVQNAQRIRSNTIVQVHTVFFGREVAWLQMELVEGHDLEAELEARRREQRPLSPREALDYALSCADALAHAHSVGILHRDVKPSNFLLPRDGPRIAKLGDFGISKHRDAAHLTATGEFPGTPAYAAPEIFAGRPATRASDVYSLGIVIYRILAGGRMPFPLSDHPTPMEFLTAHRFGERQRLIIHWPEVGSSLEQDIMRALDKAPRLRPAAFELRDALRRERRRLQTMPVTEATRARGRRPSFRALGAFVVLGAVLTLGYKAPLRREAPPAAAPSPAAAAPPPQAASPPAPAAPVMAASTAPEPAAARTLQPTAPRPAPREARAEPSPPSPPAVEPTVTPAPVAEAAPPEPIASPPAAAPPVQSDVPPADTPADPPAPAAAATPAFSTLATVTIDGSTRVRGRVLFEPSAPRAGGILTVTVWVLNEGTDTLRIEDLGVVVTSGGQRRGRPAAPLARQVKPGQRQLLARVEDDWAGSGAWRMEVFVGLQGGSGLKGTLKWQ
jgi:eukaryotic-like serine/threonine-protein kinase